MRRINGSQPTYEELKRLSLAAEEFGARVLSLPMRNWNQRLGFKAVWRHCVLSLPMRNWNTTMESLARRFWSMFSAYLWGIETLPRFFHNKIGISSQPTYEELKRVYEDLNVKTMRVLSLPMRNWNWETLSWWFINSGFSAYLWGIETQNLNRIVKENLRSQPTYEELKPE